MDRIKVHITRVRPDEDQDIDLPRYMTSRSAGLDLCAAVKEPLVIECGGIELAPTGLAIALPDGFEAQIRPRSGLALKKGLTLINAPGTIDSDYRGEILLAMINLGREPVEIKRGDRVAQMVISRVWQAELEIVDSLDGTKRGSGGFGHTG